jgi:hypothetical protein
MGTSAPTLEKGLTSSAESLAELPAAVFVERWRLITGEPPAVLLDSRAEMLALLVQSSPVAPLELLVSTQDSPPCHGCTAR